MSAQQLTLLAATISFMLGMFQIADREGWHGFALIGFFTLATYFGLIGFFLY